MRTLPCFALSLLLAPPSGAEAAIAPPPVATIEWRPTRFETTEGRRQAVDADTGTLWVELDWARPGRGRLGLNAVRFRATGTKAGPPIVYLAGGPGGSATRSAAGDRFPFFMALREAGDVIALDQRGVLSTPFPSCRTPIEIPFDQPGSLDNLLAALMPAARRCAERWQGEGLDLSVLNTSQSADDLAALGKSLGVERLHLVSISYGTQVALATLKRHPDLVARVVLAGTEPLDATLKLPSAVDRHVDRIAALADEEPGLFAATGGLRAGVRRLLDELRARPRTVRAAGREGRPREITLGPLDLQRAVWDRLHEREDIERFPAQLARTLRGDWSDLARWAMASRSLPGLSALAHVADCSSGASPERLAAIEREAATALLGNAANAPFPEICAAWPHHDLGEAFRAPLDKAAAPALFIHGTLDGRTPRENADDVARGFTDARHLRIVRGGHDDDLLISTPTIARLVVAFLAGANVPAQDVELPPLRFAPPG